ncbi:MAG: putative domain HDIG-containing protein [Clostridiales bacterium]|jgi:putative nucleotidyltransferase with HDIG domain|nr:putative domain HDIG-containing protein [Clostridiales bacterium]
MRLISTDYLTSDMMLAKDIYYEGRFLLKAGITNVNKYLGTLNNIGIRYIYIEDDSSKGIEIPDLISDETRRQCQSALKETLDNFISNCTIDIDNLRNPIENLLSEIINSEEILVSLNDINVKDDYTLAHSISTTVYSLLIAKKLNYSYTLMEKLAEGTLLHDIGKILIDNKVLFKEGSLDDEEFKLIQQHTVLGYNLLKKNSLLSEASRIISLSHHERVDGLGYPNGLRADELHEFSKITTIADVYDALTSDRCYRSKWPARKALDYLIENSGIRFDTELVTLFTQQIAVFPNGSTVRLSDGCLGIIEKQNANMPLRPIVRVIRDQEGSIIPYYSIDLLSELSITIIESELEIQNRSSL